MGNRKRNASIKRKESKKAVAFASLKDYPISPRKAVLVANLIRGMEVQQALAVLNQLNKALAPALYRLVKSALANYYSKMQNLEGDLYIAVIHVTQGMMLKRIQPAPQGRAHRILKRYSHIRVEIAEKQVHKLNVTEKIQEAV